MVKRTFVYGATVLLAANLINRILGFVYQYLIMTHIGGEAYGLFTMVFPVYMTALVLTTAGIPLAISKMISEEISLGQEQQAARIFHLALGILTVSGIVVTLALYKIAPVMSHRLFPDPRVLKVFLICTPAIFVVSVASAFRGYFQGKQNMVPTALSQICEQIVRISVGFTLALRFLPRGVEWGAAGLAFGMLAGEFAGLLIIVLQYLFGPHAPLRSEGTARATRAGTRGTLRRLFQLSSPVTVGRLLSTGLSAADAMIIPQRLQAAGYTAREATTLFGQLGGSAFTLLTFPSVFTLALATSLVPAISEAAAQKQFHLVRARSGEAIRLTVIVGLPALLVLFMYATPLTAFFKSPAIAPILRILVFGGIFSYVQQATNGILQGLGKVQLPVLHSIAGAAVRIPLIIILTAMPQWGLLGAALAYVLGFVVMALLNLHAISRHTGLPLDLQHFLLQPLSAGIGMLVTLRLLYLGTGESPLSYILQVAAGLVVYGLILFFNGAVKPSDLRRLPWIGKYI
ncbi:stage V sporulation protein B [Acididesulfobacillus acetoxydans]|uniref:Stage V sporulation protein B n=1 Tax=Acididesulfobacillus acetoxydans TaxID=1561005 RepID=A0A8S0WYC4_9FIRM|nr:stage V sporulation protein B [Acididesulfobacillus acetoxydans]CAA7601401.1 stage V sporulation protein B [Acididesulfobacillus acetoxydans]CEJ08832.1 Stage V sporulation protein B [Acididesulfobacillus acetoxydans]